MAWILSQPDKVEDFGRNESWIRQKPAKLIADDPHLAGNHPENISHPADVLGTLLGRYFEQEQKRGGITKKQSIKYHKTRHGPEMLALLDLSRLRSTFSDVEAIAVRLS